MTAAIVLTRLVELFPDFEARWVSPDCLHRDQDGASTICGVFMEFSCFLLDSFASCSAVQLDGLGEFVEFCMEAPDSDLDTAVTTCFLENMAGERFTASLASHLGVRARLFLSQFGESA